MRSDKCLVSTTWAYRLVKIASPPKAPTGTPPQASSKRPSTRWPRRDKLTLTIVHRGGSESWYEVRARGVTWRFPGHRCIEDVMAQIYGEW